MTSAPALLALIAMMSLLMMCSVFASTDPQRLMPAQKPNTGVKTLYCVVVNWTNLKSATRAQCKRLANYVARFYKINSNGQLILQPHTGAVSTGIAASAGNVAYGERLARRKYFNADYFIIPNKYNGGDHASGIVAHLGQVLYTVAVHEVGHLLSIEHTVRLVPTPNGGRTAIADTGSIMNPFAKASQTLTAPQYYYLGWLDPLTVSNYDGSSTGHFTLNRPLEASNGAYAIIIIRSWVMKASVQGRDAFISFPAQCQDYSKCVALHLIAQPDGVQGGSQLVSEIPLSSSFFDKTYTGLTIKTSSATDGDNQVTVTLSFS